MMGIPGSVGVRHLGINAVTGLDFLLVLLFPRAWVIGRLARKIVRFAGPPAGPGDLTFTIPQWSGVWEILDAQGHTRLFTRKETP